jgi:hypothetical protein
MGLKREIVRTALCVVGLAIACSAGGRGKETKVSRGPTGPTGAAGSPSSENGKPHQAGSGATTGENPNAVDAVIDTASDMMDNLVPEAKAQSGSRLKARWNVGDDGAKQFVDWQDTELDAECYFATMWDGTLRCLPLAEAAQLMQYSDSGCSVRLFGKLQSECSQSVTARFGVAPTIVCGVAQYRAFQLGNRVDPTDVYTGTPATCSKTTPAQGYIYFAVAAELPPSRFAAAHVQIDN